MKQRLTGRSNYRFRNYALNLHFSHLEEVYSTYHFVLWKRIRKVNFASRAVSGCRFVFRPSICFLAKHVSRKWKAKLDSEKPSLVAKSRAKLRKAELCSDASLRIHWMFFSSKTKHKEVWEVGAEVQRLIVDRCSYKCLHNPVWERIKNVAIHYHKTHLNFSLKCSFVRGTCEIEVHLKLA